MCLAGVAIVLDLHGTLGGVLGVTGDKKRVFSCAYLLSSHLVVHKVCDGNI